MNKCVTASTYKTTQQGGDCTDISKYFHIQFNLIKPYCEMKVILKRMMIQFHFPLQHNSLKFCQGISKKSKNLMNSSSQVYLINLDNIAKSHRSLINVEK